MKSRRTAWLALCSLSLGCGGGGGAGGGGAAPAAPGGASPPPPPARAFVNVTTASNLGYVTRYSPPSLSSILDSQILAVTYGGAAAGDCDRDGDIDLFITYGDHGPNRLYLNLLDLGNLLLFEDAAAEGGVDFTHSPGRNDRHSGPIFADMDGDFDLDLFIGGIFGDANKVYENLGDCSFRDATTGSGLEALTTPHTISAALGDYDLDGRPDLFLTHWGSPPSTAAGSESEHLFRNVSDSNGIRFENVSAESRVTEHVLAVADVTDFSMTATIARINDDLWPDIALASDFEQALLLLGDPNFPGWFFDATNDAIRSIDNAMGSALGDFDSDGDLDWFVTSIFGVGNAAPVADGNSLLVNPGGDLTLIGFDDAPADAAVENGMWGWAACFLDIDNDGDLDIYHTNGWPYPYYDADYRNDRSRAFVSNGEGQFSERATLLGLTDSKDGRGVVCADFDNDGDMDILQLTNDPTNSVTLWANNAAASGRNSLRMRLVGLPPNTQAAGARIYATIGQRTQMREIRIGSNYTTQNPMVQVLGLGSSASVDELRIEWPPLAPGPVQPADTVRTGVPASRPQTTLVICHPELNPKPAICS